MVRSPIHMHTPISISLSVTTKPTLSLYFSPSTQFLTLSTTLVWNLMKQYSNKGIANPTKMLPSIFTLLLIFLHCNLSLATPSTPTTTTADSNKNQTVSKKDQIACTVCNECENPCPVPSTPPPVVEYPPPPPPALPPPELEECPPPPALPPPEPEECPPPPALPPAEPEECPPPPQLPCPGNCYTPKPPSGPNRPFPPNGPKPYLSPPNPIVPYFPYYYYYPPGYTTSNSLHLKLNPFVSSIVIFLTSLLCFF